MALILDELRRRRVFRSVAAYVVACWVMIEAADVIFPYLSLPESAVRVVIVASLIGFPVVLVLAWFFDITPAGIVLTPDRDEKAAPSPRLFGRWTDLLLIGLLAIAVAYIILEQLGEREHRTAGALRSIAVLPFTDLSPESDSAYLGDGVAEELLHTLATIEGLRVAARTSSFAFRDGNQSIQEIGTALDVDTVLEGSVRKDDRANRVRVTAQLIDARDGFHLWSETYEGALDDVFKIQDQIASSIAGKLQLTLLGEASPIPGDTTDSVKAYELYLKGRNAAHRRTEASLLEAKDYFERATEVDPEYALAYTGYADSLSLLINYGNARLSDIQPQVERLVDRALELQPELPEAYASLGLLRLQQQQYPAAEEALQKSLALQPANEQALTWYGGVLLAQDRYRDALATYLKAYDRDPLSIPLNVNLGNLLDTMGHHVQAESHFRRLLELKPEDTGLYHNSLMQSAHARGDMTETARWAYRELERDPNNLLALFHLVRVYIDLDVANEAEYWLSAMEDLHKEDFITLQARSLWHIATGEYQENLAYVQERISVLAENLSEFGVGLPPGVLAWLGSAYYFAGDIGAAREAYEQALSFDGGIEAPTINTTNQTWLPWLIRVYRSQDATEQAKVLISAMQDYLDKEMAAGIDTASVHGQRAQLMSLAGDQDEALRELEAAAERGFRQTYYLDAADDLAGVLSTAEGQKFLHRIETLRAADRSRLRNLPAPEYRPAASPEPIALEPSVRERYARRYRLENGLTVMIQDTAEGLKLLAPGLPPELLQASSATDFFVRESSLRLRFVLDDRGRLRHFLWLQYGDAVRGRPITVPRELAIFEIDPLILDDYVGRYAFEGVAGLGIQFVRRDDELYGSITGQPSIPYTPTGVDEFRNELVGATVRFRRDRTGQVTEMVIEQDGKEMRAPRE